MNACMGKDLTGEMAKSQAFLVFKSSYEFTASTAAAVLDDIEDLPALDPFPYNKNIIKIIIDTHE